VLARVTAREGTTQTPLVSGIVAFPELAEDPWGSILHTPQSIPSPIGNLPPK